ncbi:MAG: HAD hydrolase family protein [Myxococcales bacterium]|nr:MAG: HAD hydrolase family protein [Myxococcales bacterium]
MKRRSRIRLIAFDIDGVLTTSQTFWLGEELGWSQFYSVRDGEAFLRLRAGGYILVPISANKTLSAKKRMEQFAFDCTWLGVSDKLTAINEATAKYQVSFEETCYVADGLGDVEALKQVGLGIAPCDAHPVCKTAAKHVLKAKGGSYVIEELELYLINKHA